MCIDLINYKIYLANKIKDIGSVDEEALEKFLENRIGTQELIHSNTELINKYLSIRK